MKNCFLLLKTFNKSNPNPNPTPNPSRGRPSSKLHFYFNNTESEIVKEYKYLGIFLYRSETFKTAKKYISEEANKYLFIYIENL